MRRWWVVNTHLSCLTPGKETHYPLYMGLVWASRPVWIGAENVTAVWFRASDLPACRELLY